MFLTPMWAADWQILSSEYKLLKVDHKLQKQGLGGYMRLRKVAKVNTGLSYKPDFDANVEEFAQLYKLKVVQLKGCTDITKRCYHEAKRGICEGASFEK